MLEQRDLQSDYGSFKDSLRAPIHRWFTYPAGYSHKFVSSKIAEYDLQHTSTIADPFLGTGTTSIAAKMLGIHSVGIEAHKFIHWVAQTKMFFNHDIPKLATAINQIIEYSQQLDGKVQWNGVWPPLLYKCFTDHNLKQLAALRKAIIEVEAQPQVRDFLKLALTATLRVVTTAGAGWPYIAPSKYQSKKIERDAFVEFRTRCNIMLSDIQYVQSLNLPYSSHEVRLGDSRQFNEYVPCSTVDLIVTSPPYLNNYDYADRTRLETYFWGMHESWADITRDVREHLVMSATTQVRISLLNGIRECPGIRQVDKHIHAELSKTIARLEVMRTIKNGKKTYDYVVAGYFEDMLQTLISVKPTLKPGAPFVLVLGDSAPYGVHIPTEQIVGQLAMGVGFTDYKIEQLRTRGNKWGGNPQRHKVPLRESVLTILN